MFPNSSIYHSRTLKIIMDSNGFTRRFLARTRSILSPRSTSQQVPVNRDRINPFPSALTTTSSPLDSQDDLPTYNLLEWFDKNGRPGVPLWTCAKAMSALEEDPESPRPSLCPGLARIHPRMLRDFEPLSITTLPGLERRPGP